MWHGYMLIEDLGLTANQRQTLFDYLKSLGDNEAPMPAHRNHWRIRLDNKAMIYEAMFVEATLTIQNVKNKLAEIFNVDVNTINHSINNGFVTFNRSGDKLLMKLFAETISTREESRQECLAYLHENLIDWNTDD